MKLFRTALGIDLSGSRIALLAVRRALGGLPSRSPRWRTNFGRSGRMPPRGGGIRHRGIRRAPRAGGSRGLPCAPRGARPHGPGGLPSHAGEGPPRGGGAGARPAFPPPPGYAAVRLHGDPRACNGGKDLARRGGGFPGIPGHLRSAPFPGRAVPGRFGAFGVGGGHRRFPDPGKALAAGGRSFRAAPLVGRIRGMHRLPGERAAVLLRPALPGEGGAGKRASPSRWQAWRKRPRGRRSRWTCTPPRGGSPSRNSGPGRTISPSA